MSAGHSHSHAPAAANHERPLWRSWWRKASAASDELTRLATRMLADRFDLHHVTVQVERAPCALADARQHRFS